MRINKHHIDYGPKEWTVNIKGYMHKTLTIIQRTKPTESEYCILTDFMHAIAKEWNRYRKAIDLEDNE
jgi:hypothetical protein